MSKISEMETTIGELWDIASSINDIANWLNSAFNGTEKVSPAPEPKKVLTLEKIRSLQVAISGKQWSCYKAVEGFSNRKYTDENAVIVAVTTAGYAPFEHKILCVTAMTSLLKRKQLNDIFGGLTTKPQGRPALVPDSKKRPVMIIIFDNFKTKRKPNRLFDFLSQPIEMEVKSMTNKNNTTNVVSVIIQSEYIHIWKFTSADSITSADDVSLVIHKSIIKSIVTVKQNIVKLGGKISNKVSLKFLFCHGESFGGKYKTMSDSSTGLNAESLS